MSLYFNTRLQNVQYKKDAHISPPLEEGASSNGRVSDERAVTDNLNCWYNAVQYETPHELRRSPNLREWQP